MDPAVEEIIKNIIHIDKSAVELKKKLEDDVDKRKRKVEAEIKKLEDSVVKGAAEKSGEIRREELGKAEEEAETIRAGALEKTKEMELKFLKEADKFTREIFRDIFLIR